MLLNHLCTCCQYTCCGVGHVCSEGWDLLMTPGGWENSTMKVIISPLNYQVGKQNGYNTPKNIRDTKVEKNVTKGVSIWKMQSNASVKSSHLINKIWNLVILMVIMNSKLTECLQCHRQHYFVLHTTPPSLKSSMSVTSMIA